MNGKLLVLAVGIGIGFLLGSRAGRGPYEKVAAKADQVWHDPRVQQQVDRSMKFANEKIEDVAGIATEGARNLVHRVTAPKSKKASGAATSAE